MLATKCGAGNKVSTRQHEDDEEGREVLGRAREKEGYFPFRKMLRRARVSTCARAMGVCASLDPSLPFGPKRHNQIFAIKSRHLWLTYQNLL
jgi:hypothetical protein